MGKVESILSQSERGLSLGSAVEEKDVEREPLVFPVVLVLKEKEGIVGALRPALSQPRIISLTSEISRKVCKCLLNSSNCLKCLWIRLGAKL